MVLPSRLIRESITLSSMEVHLGQRMDYFFVTTKYTKDTKWWEPLRTSVFCEVCRLIQGQEIFQDVHAILSGDGLGMKLDAPDGQGLVAQAHDFAFGGLGGDFKTVGHAFFFDEEGVVAGGGESLRHVFEDIGALMLDGRGFAVHQSVSAHDLATEVLADGLAAETDAKDGSLTRKGSDHFHGDSRLGGGTGAG